MKALTFKSIILFGIFLMIVSCKKTDPSQLGYLNPDYDIVFNQNEVQRLDIVIDPAYWTVMQEDLQEMKTMFDKHMILKTLH